MTEPLRILQVGGSAALFGLERWIVALVRHLDPSRIESVVAAIRRDAGGPVPLYDEAARMGFQAHVIDAPGRFNWDAVRQLRALIDRENVAIVHTHGYRQDVIGFLATRGRAVRLLSTPHGWSTQLGLKLRCYEWLDRAIFPFFDAVAPLSGDLMHSLERIPGLKSKLTLIENGVDLTEVDEPVEIAPEVAAWRSDGIPVIGYIGQVIPRKGLDVLLRALSFIPGKSWRGAIVGSGESEAQLVGRAEELGLAGKVRFFGYRADRMAFLKGFDLFVLPSHLEGIPRCLMEAMAAGVPVVASDIPGCRELVADGAGGRLVPPGNAEVLARVLGELLDSPAVRTRLGEAGREIVRARFSARRMAKEYEALYSRLAGDEAAA